MECRDEQREAEIESQAKHPFVVDGNGHREEIPSRNVHDNQVSILRAFGRRRRGGEGIRSHIKSFASSPGHGPKNKVVETTQSDCTHDTFACA